MSIFDLDEKFGNYGFGNASVDSQEPKPKKKRAGRVGKPAAEMGPDDVEDASDLNKILKNYAEIPKAEWKSIQPGTYIRYKTDRGLHTGARVKSIIQNDDQLTFILEKRKPYAKSTNWSINLIGVSAIYKFVDKKKEPDPAQLKATPFEQLGDKLLFDDADTIKQRIDALEAKTQRLEQENKSILRMVKLLYERIQKTG
jgi:hypothetical protein